MTFHDLLSRYRAVAFSERDKGDRFERLMQAFLQTVPWYEGTFRHVWLWREFPYRQDLGGKDTGIDLVAQTVEGDFWAIQCKFHDARARIDKPAVDSFLATSSKRFAIDAQQTTSFALRLWISTTNNWGSGGKMRLCQAGPIGHHSRSRHANAQTGPHGHRLQGMEIMASVTPSRAFSAYFRVWAACSRARAVFPGRNGTPGVSPAPLPAPHTAKIHRLAGGQ